MQTRDWRERNQWIADLLQLTSVDEIDDEVEALLERAYAENSYSDRFFS